MAPLAAPVHGNASHLVRLYRSCVDQLDGPPLLDCSVPDQIDWLARTMGRALGPKFFAAQSPGFYDDFYEAIVRGHWFDDRGAAARALLYGRGKHVHRERIVRAIARGAGVLNTTLESSVRKFVDQQHHAFSSYALHEPERVLEEVEHARFHVRFGSPDDALSAYRCALGSKAFVKNAACIGGVPRGEYFMALRREAIVFCQQAQAPMAALRWCERLLRASPTDGSKSIATSRDAQLAATLLQQAAFGLAHEDDKRGHVAVNAEHVSARCAQAPHQLISLWATLAALPALQASGPGVQQATSLAQWAGMTQRLQDARRVLQQIDWPARGLLPFDRWPQPALPPEREWEGPRIAGLCGLPPPKTAVLDVAAWPDACLNFREAILNRARGAVAQQNSLLLVTAWGTPGQGKTTLLRAVADDLRRITNADADAYSRPVVAVDLPGPTVIRPIFGETPRTLERQLQQLESYGETHNKTILVQCDDVENLFGKDEGRGSAAIENRRIAQVMHRWLDGSLPNQHVFFLFSLNDVTALTGPIANRLLTNAVCWRAPLSSKLKQLRQSPLNGPGRQSTLDARYEGISDQNYESSDHLTAFAQPLSPREIDGLIEQAKLYQQRDPSFSWRCALYEQISDLHERKAHEPWGPNDSEKHWRRAIDGSWQYEQSWPKDLLFCQHAGRWQPRFSTDEINVSAHLHDGALLLLNACASDLIIRFFDRREPTEKGAQWSFYLGFFLKAGERWVTTPLHLNSHAVVVRNAFFEMEAGEATQLRVRVKLEPTAS